MYMYVYKQQNTQYITSVMFHGKVVPLLTESALICRVHCCRVVLSHGIAAAIKTSFRSNDEINHTRTVRPIFSRWGVNFKKKGLYFLCSKAQVIGFQALLIRFKRLLIACNFI